MTAEVFYQKDGVEITEAMFKAPDGTNYPVRNLSSVMTLKSEKKWLLILGVLLVLFGAFVIAQTGNSNDWKVGLAFVAVGVVALIVQRLRRRVALVVTAGGVQRHAIVYPLNDENVRSVNDIKDSLTLALLKVQGSSG